MNHSSGMQVCAFNLTHNLTNNNISSGNLFSNSSCSSNEDLPSSSSSSFPPPPLGWTDVALIFLFLVIFVVGIIGNLLVMLLILRFPRMRSVTNVYLFNLAVCDFCYLWGIPITAATLYYRKWVFGDLMCKLFYSSTASNWFANVFTVTVLSADRYVAVCKSRAWSQHRTKKLSLMVCLVVWVLSVCFMLPINMYAYVLKTVEEGITYVSCTLDWTWERYNINSETLFVLYAFILSFAIPVPVVSFFYISVIAKLAQAANMKSASQVKRSQKRVTVMVLSVITAFVVSWLPYWVGQMILIFSSLTMRGLNTFLAVLNYANSALNPILYAFLSETFRHNLDNLMHCSSVKPNAVAKTIDPTKGNDDETRLPMTTRRSIELKTIDLNEGEAITEILPQNAA